MKKIFSITLLFAMFFGNSYAQSDTMYVLRNGDVISKFAVSDIDSVIFYQPPWLKRYNVTYNGNGNTDGSAPVDNYLYVYGDSVTVLGNSGNLIKMQDGISLHFEGWNSKPDGTGNDYLVDKKSIRISSDTVLYAKWSVVRGIGPAGGWIIYDKGSYSDGWRYVEMGPADLGPKKWGTAGININGAERYYVGDGKLNTLDIVANDTLKDKAADVCLNYSVTNNSIVYDDWYLPSLHELYAMRDNLYLYGIGGLTQLPYWSSTEILTYANYYYIYYGGTGTKPKDWEFYFRPVRYF